MLRLVKCPVSEPMSDRYFANQIKQLFTIECRKTFRYLGKKIIFIRALTPAANVVSDFRDITKGSFQNVCISARIL